MVEKYPFIVDLAVYSAFYCLFPMVCLFTSRRELWEDRDYHIGLKTVLGTGIIRPKIWLALKPQVNELRL